MAVCYHSVFVSDIRVYVHVPKCVCGCYCVFVCNVIGRHVCVCVFVCLSLLTFSLAPSGWPATCVCVCVCVFMVLLYRLLLCVCV